MRRKMRECFFGFDSIGLDSIGLERTMLIIPWVGIFLIPMDHNVQTWVWHYARYLQVDESEENLRDNMFQPPRYDAISFTAGTVCYSYTYLLCLKSSDFHLLSSICYHIKMIRRDANLKCTRKFIECTYYFFDETKINHSFAFSNFTIIQCNAHTILTPSW